MKPVRIAAFYNRFLAPQFISKKFETCSRYCLRKRLPLSCQYNLANNFFTHAVTRNQLEDSQVPQVETESSPENSKSNSIFKYFDNLSTLDDDQLLKMIEKVNSTDLAGAVSGGKKLDEECIKRAEHWNSEKFIAFLKRYHEVGKFPKSKFIKYAVKNRFERIVNGPLPNIIDYFRIISERNGWYRAPLNGYEVEYALEKFVSDLQCADIQLFLEPLIYSQKHIISKELIKSLCDKFMNEIDELPQSVIRSFFTLMCHQAVSPKNPGFLVPKLYEIVKMLTEKFEHLDLDCVSRIALFCSRMLIYDSSILKKIADNLLKALHEPSTNLSTIERVMEMLTFFNYKPTENEINLYLELTTVLKSDLYQCKIESDRISFLKILAHLSLVNVYPVDLLDEALTKSFLKKAYKKITPVNVPYEIRLLLGGIKYDHISINATYLKLDDCIKDWEQHAIKFPKILRRHDYSDALDSESLRYLSPYNRVLYDVRALLDDIFGGVEYSHICYRFLHLSRANILFCMHKRGHPQKISSELRKRIFLGRDKLLELRNINCMVVFKSKNRYMDYEPLYMGEEIAKVRHLENLGYRLISLTQQGWLRIPLLERRELLRNLIFFKAQDNKSS